MTRLKALPATLIVLAALGPAPAADGPAASLDLSGKGVKKFEVSQSQIGFTSTRVFYTLSDQRVIVVIHIDNTTKFPVNGKVCRFGKDVTADGMAKWLNNQHSDGLFPDVPEPEVSTKLPPEACKVLASKLLGKEQGVQGAYEKYSVEFKIDEVKVNDQLLLKEFKDTVKVFVPVK